ncbi:MAG: DNA repair protein RecO [Nitrospirae bacterium]|nr:DNA repair protein RecO [Nitrospirota bacterium]
MRNLATEAIVLKATPFGESDRLVTLFTREAGLLSAMAKGAQRSRKRFGGTLDSLSKVQAMVQWRKSNAMPLLAAASLVDFGLGIRSDLRRVAQASYMGELIWRGSKPGVRMMDLYDACCLVLGRLAAEGPEPDTLAWFLLKLQTAHGYRPKLDVCSICQGPIGAPNGNRGPRTTSHDEVPMSYKSGGVVCSRCADRAEINMQLPVGALSWLQSLSNPAVAACLPSPHASPFTANDLRLTAHEQRAAQQFLHRFILFHLEFQPASWRWWHRIVERTEA